MDFDGACAVVTGGSSGIGLGMCKALGRRGAALVIADIEKARAEEAAQTFRRQGIDAMAVATDVADPESVGRLADTVYSRHERVALLACNAGVVNVKSLVDSTAEEWSWIVGVTLFGTVHTLRAFLPRMIAARGPRHIAVTASMASLRAPPMPGQTMYTASKFGQLGLMLALSHEIEAHGIGMTIAFPGPVQTDLMAGSARRKPGGTSAPHPASAAHAAYLSRVAIMEPDAAGEIIVEGLFKKKRFIATHPELWPQVEAVQRELADAFGRSLPETVPLK